VRGPPPSPLARDVEDLVELAPLGDAVDHVLHGAPRLVVRGLYRWVRHPLYTAGLVFLWFTPIMAVNLLALYVGFSLYLVIGAYFEERKLLREFGADYAEYQQRTPMLIPRLRRNQ